MSRFPEAAITNYHKAEGLIKTKEMYSITVLEERSKVKVLVEVLGEILFLPSSGSGASKFSGL